MIRTMAALRATFARASLSSARRAAAFDARLALPS